MGTTESIFYDYEEDAPDRPAAAPQPYPPHAANPSLSPRDGQRGPPVPSTVRRSSAPPLRSPRLSPRKIPAQTASSPVVRHPAAPPLQLPGMVLGMAGSGKHTLLQRLEGKEPVFGAGAKRKSGSEATTGNSAVEATAAPYRAPPNLPTWEDHHIVLEVTASRKVSKTTTATPLDFFVLLVDPRSSRSKIEKYLTKSIRSIVRVQGLGEKSSLARPFCLCLLRNFRDLLNEDDEEEDSCIISESDLTSWTMEVLQEFPDLDPSAMVLQCENVSLFNCYGLGRLHHFIYQAYLQRKRFDLERQLRQVSSTMSRARQEAPPAVSHKEYCEQIEQLVNGGRRRPDDETATTATNSSGAPRRQIAVVPQRRRASSGEESSSTLPSTQQSFVNSKDALEAFLESDSEGESTNEKVRKESTSDEEEEEFFYDESGIRSIKREMSTTNVDEGIDHEHVGSEPGAGIRSQDKPSNLTVSIERQRSQRSRDAEGTKEGIEHEAGGSKPGAGDPSQDEPAKAKVSIERFAVVEKSPCAANCPGDGSAMIANSDNDAERRHASSKKTGIEGSCIVKERGDHRRKEDFRPDVNLKCNHDLMVDGRSVDETKSESSHAAEGSGPTRSENNDSRETEGDSELLVDDAAVKRGNDDTILDVDEVVADTVLDGENAGFVEGLNRMMVQAPVASRVSSHDEDESESEFFVEDTGSEHLVDNDLNEERVGFSIGGSGGCDRGLVRLSDLNINKPAARHATTYETDSAEGNEATGIPVTSSVSKAAEPYSDPSTSGLSEAARAALAAAQMDFERIFQDTEKIPKKPKKEKGEKKKKKEKKSKTSQGE